MLQISMRALLRAAGAFALASTLIACGGSREEADTSALSVGDRISVKDADGASVSYLPTGNQPSQAVTVRVARDGSGAPPLPAGYVAAGAVYQFTPLGLARPGIEVRVPLGADAASANGAASPVLLVAQPGGSWMQLTDVVRDGSMLVATVPQLAYAVPVMAASEFTQAAGARKTGGRLQAYTGEPQTNPLLRMVVDAATTPPLPDPVVVNNSGTKLSTVTQATALSLTVHYNLPAVCTGTRTAEVKALFAPSGQQITLAQRVLSQPSGSFTVATSLSAAQNGFFTAAAAVECSGQTPAQRYVTMANPPLQLLLNIAATPAPAITQAPQDANVVEGATAIFSVTASGNNIVYQWQRSNDGGSSYTNVPGATAASVSLAAALADNNSLWRVVLSNAGGSTTSTPARLAVTQQVVVPAITSDPANQTVVEGQTASFTVAGSGAPAPTIQWQTRSAADAASGNAQQGWADLPGATAATYTTAATTLAQSGAQYRAVLQNSAGSASSLAATLAVNAAVVAPAITTQPLPQSVQAGQSGLFAVAASGTSPLSYQWFKNGQAIVGANATEVLVPAEAADVGSSYQISVQVSNAAGSVSSAVVVMSVTAVPVTGTLISAAVGGTISAGIGAETDPVLFLPANALAADTRISVTVAGSSTAGLPPEVTPLGDVVSIEPAGLSFLLPATLTLPVPDALPDGKVLALVEIIAATANADKQNRKQVSHGVPASAIRTTAVSANLRRLAEGKALPRGVVTLKAGDSFRPLCAQAANQVGGQFLTAVASAVSVILAAVPEQLCADSAPSALLDAVPSDQTSPCTTGQYLPATLGPDATLVSRHVNCQLAGAEDVNLLDDRGDYGSFRLEMRLGTHGPSTGLQKTYRVSFRLTRLTAGASLPALRLRPNFSCAAQGSFAGNCTHAASTTQLSDTGAWSSPIDVVVNFEWAGSDGTWSGFAFDDVVVNTALPQQNLGDATNVNFLRPPEIRCDKGVAKAGSNGCVFPQAAAVYLLRLADGSVKEAAQHIVEAQAAGSPGGGFTLAQGKRAVAGASGAALRRAKSEAIQGLNRDASCGAKDSSLINVRQPLNQSASCAANQQPCSCDEYPFASTWDGGNFAPGQTSVKRINGKHNENAGGGKLSSGFYARERVLDFTNYTGAPFSPYDPSLESNRGGDDFWVLVK
jgi:hypothetical protein